MLTAPQVCPPDSDSQCPCASTQCVGGACRPGLDGTCPIPTTHFKELDLTTGQTVKVMLLALALTGRHSSLTRGSWPSTLLAGQLQLLANKTHDPAPSQPV